MDILTIITGESWFIAPKSRGSKSRRNCNTALSPLRQKLFGKNVTQLCIDWAFGTWPDFTKKKSQNLTAVAKGSFTHYVNPKKNPGRGARYWSRDQLPFVAFCSFFPCSLTVFHRGRQWKSGGRQWISLEVDNRITFSYFSLNSM